MKKTLCTTLLTVAAVTTSNGALVQTFQTDLSGGGTISPLNILTVTMAGLSDGGVTFDAALTVVGSADLDIISTGLGVLGGGTDLVNAGEFLTFTMAVSNVSGGTINFDGFTDVDFNNLGATDAATLSLDASEATSGDNFFTTATGAENVDISGISPIAFSAIANASASNSFRIDDVTGSFTGTVVPEPSSTALLGLGGLVLILRRRK